MKAAAEVLYPAASKLCSDRACICGSVNICVGMMHERVRCTWQPASYTHTEPACMFGGVKRCG